MKKGWASPCLGGNSRVPSPMPENETKANGWADEVLRRDRMMNA
jgi:hypothetical protein